MFKIGDEVCDRYDTKFKVYKVETVSYSGNWIKVKYEKTFKYSHSSNFKLSLEIEDSLNWMKEGF